jgi:hypothetical protein
MRRTALRSMSKKRRSLLALRRQVVATVHQRDQVCQAAARLPQIGCGGPLDVHEVVPRSVDTAGWLNPDRAMLVCRVHHAWIGDHPLDAHALGLHRFSWELFE